MLRFFGLSRGPKGWGLVVGQKREALFNCSRAAADHPQQTLRNHPVAASFGWGRISTKTGDLATLFWPSDDNTI
jgi:hypothetical protein